MTRARSLSRLANSQAFTVDSDLDVGINSTSPSSKLDVGGDIIVSGVVTATSFVGDVTGNADTATYATTAGIATVAENLTGNPSISVTDITATGNVSIAGTLTYEDVTSVDSIGIITAQNGIDVTGGDINVGTATTITDGGINVGTATTITDGGINVTGVITATSFSGSFSGDVSIADKIIHTGDTDTAIRFPAVDTVTVETAGSERVRVDTSGRLLVGTSTASSPDVAFEIEASGNFSPQIRATAKGSDVFPVYNVYRKSRGASIVQDNDYIFEINGQGFDGSIYISAATIRAEVDGTPGSNDMPARLLFSTTAAGASSATERMRIASDGVITAKNGTVAEIDTLTDASTVTPDFAASTNFTLTFTSAVGNSRTIANPSNLTAGQSGSIFLVQDSTGSRTVSWGSYWDWAAGTPPTLTTTGSAVDRIDYIVRTSTSIHAVATLAYS